MKVTFETKCYHKDWVHLVKKGRLRRMIESCMYNFDQRILYLNNFDNYEEVKRESDKLVAKGIIDKYVVVEDHASEALESLGVSAESFKGGYYYSIAELVSIYLCESKYLLHFSSDSIVEKSSVNWIDSAIQLMEKDPSIMVANPAWNSAYDEAKSESFREDESWFYSFGFSDQAYLVRAADLKDKIYNHYNEASDRYPLYGGELFEKRVDSYMRNMNLFRLTSKNVSYSHVNFPKENLWQKIKNRF